MFSVGTNYNKLKTNLRLAVNRLKLLEKKKTELTQKARKEIADYISANKQDRARIRVEHIIREDYLVEAYELLEMYCDLILARFGLLQQMKTLDEGLEEAINSILWAAPRLWADIQEFKAISDQLTAKYGKPFAEACRDNSMNKVSPKLLQKMAVHAPPKLLVEKYMIEIARSHNVPFTPDESVMREDEIANAEAMLIDFQNMGQQGFGWSNYPPPTMYGAPPSYNGAPPSNQNKPPGGPHFGGGGGGGMPAASYPTAGAGQVPGAKPFNYPNLKVSAPATMEVKVPFGGPPSAPDDSEPPTGGGNFLLPDVPTNVPDKGNSGANTPKNDESGNDLDFDDLTRRFDELKKRR